MAGTINNLNKKYNAVMAAEITIAAFIDNFILLKFHCTCKTIHDKQFHWHIYKQTNLPDA